MTNKPKDEQAQGRSYFGTKNSQIIKVVCIIAPIEDYSG